MPVRSGWLSAGRIAVSLTAVALTGTIVLRSDAPRALQRGPAARTTLSGIYTDAQAERGENTYLGMCVSCHPTVTYTGPGFKQNWGGKPLSDLYDWVYEKMPKNEPGTLSPAESVQVIAYILRLNKMPPGKTELTADRAALRRIRIELK